MIDLIFLCCVAAFSLFTVLVIRFRELDEISTCGKDEVYKLDSIRLSNNTTTNFIFSVVLILGTMIGIFVYRNTQENRAHGNLYKEYYNKGFHEGQQKVLSDFKSQINSKIDPSNR